jgi:sugar phosphate permease
VEEKVRSVGGEDRVDSHEQGQAGGLLNTSFQFGGALVLAVVTAVIAANTGTDGSNQAVLDGRKAGIIVSLVVAALGLMRSAQRAAAPAKARAVELDTA